VELSLPLKGYCRGAVATFMRDETEISLLRGIMLRPSIVVSVLLLATPAAADLRIPCLWNPFGGCTVTLVSPEYAARPVQPLNPQSALAEVNAFRAKHGLSALILDARLSRAADMQSENQARRSWIGHFGSDGSTPKIRAARAGYHAKIAAENVAAGDKSFSDALRAWEESSPHRRNLLLPNVSAVGVGMAQSGSGRPYWTLVLGAE
jgi:uncharacterized protein YkwD